MFARLGFTAFGGPAAHVALIEDEVVHRRKWLDRRHFMDLVSAVNFIPGPNSTELAIHLGLVRAGFRGLVAAGVCFILPAVLIILPIAWAYVTYGTLPEVRHVMAGINAAMIAVIVVALVRFAQASVTDPFTAGVAVAALAAAIVAPRVSDYPPDLLILAVAAVAGATRRYALARDISPLLLLPVAAGGGELGGGAGARLTEMFVFFLKVGGTLFGSGYVLVSYLQGGLVDRLGWLTRQELLDAVAVGQVTPGPLLTTATFIGYVLGQEFGGGSTTWAVVGAGVATAGIFLPSFLFVAVLGPLLPKVREHAAARGALDAMNAAVVALIAVVGWRLGREALAGWVTGAVFAASMVGMLVWRLNATWFILAGAVAGWLLLS